MSHCLANRWISYFAPSSSLSRLLLCKQFSSCLARSPNSAMWPQRKREKKNNFHPFCIRPYAAEEGGGGGKWAGSQNAVFPSFRFALTTQEDGLGAQGTENPGLEFLLSLPLPQPVNGLLFPLETLAILNRNSPTFNIFLPYNSLHFAKMVNFSSRRFEKGER